MNVRIRVSTVSVICLVIISILITIFLFSNGLPKNFQDWGAFGAYLSGIFGLVSAIILVATFFQMRIANRQDKEQFLLQLVNTESDKKLKDIIQLTEMLSKLIDTNPSISNRKKLPYTLAGLMEVKCTEYKVTEQHELYEAAISLMRDSRYLFSSEIHVLTLLLKRINSIHDEEQSETAKAIVKGLISDSYRFWLHCYAEVWSLEAKFYFKKWNDFDSVPEELEEYLPEPPDIPSN